MPFNISTFKTQGLPYGGARPSLFNVTLTPPAGIAGLTAAAANFAFQCRAASLPMGNIDSIDAGYFGRKIKLAGDRTFQDWNVTVYNDEDFGVRALFEAWSNAINRLVANVRDQAADNEQYKSDLLVQQLGKDGNILRSYNLVGAWPSSIEAIRLDWDTTNQIETFDVTFPYDYWLPVTETNPNSGTAPTYAAQATTDGPLGAA